MYKVKIADLYIDILEDNKHKDFFSSFLTSEDKTDITIESPKDNLDIHNKLASKIVNYDALLIHGACISYKDNGYLFIAPSGIGKTTHIRLWMKHLNDLKVINGDKPIIRIKDNKVYAYGNPWMGKEGYGCNDSVRLKAIIMLNRGLEDNIYKVDKKEYINTIFNQIYMPEDKLDLLKTMDIINGVFNKIDIYKMECTMNDSAFIKAYETLIGVKYEDK